MALLLRVQDMEKLLLKNLVNLRYKFCDPIPIVNYGIQ